jgi:hypothetical protein
MGAGFINWEPGGGVSNTRARIASVEIERAECLSRKFSCDRALPNLRCTANKINDFVVVEMIGPEHLPVELYFVGDLLFCCDNGDSTA